MAPKSVDQDLRPRSAKMMELWLMTNAAHAVVHCSPMCMHVWSSVDGSGIMRVIPNKGGMIRDGDLQIDW